MQHPYRRALCLPEPVGEHLGKEMMVAIPLALCIQWNEEKIGAFQIFQDHLRRCIAQLSSVTRHGQGVASVLTSDEWRMTYDGITEWPAQSFQDGSLQQKGVYLLWLLAEHFFYQVVEDIAIAAAEG